MQKPEHHILVCTSFRVSGADLGFILHSALYSDNLNKYKNTTSYIVLPESSYDPIRQGLVIVDYGKELLLFDEPFAFLDIRTAWHMADVIKEFQNKSPMILVSHDIELLSALSDRIFVMENGRLYESNRINQEN